MKDNQQQYPQLLPFGTFAIILAGIALVAIAVGAVTNAERNFVRYESSAVMQEPATVSDLIFTPANHASDVSPTFGVDMNGNANIGFAVTSVTMPEKYAVVFECEHGKFIIQKDQQQAKKLWRTLKKGQAVTVYYKEVYRITEYGKPNGPKQFVSKELAKYDFLNAK
jgi:hypothetical protein